MKLFPTEKSVAVPWSKGGDKDFLRVTLKKGDVLRFNLCNKEGKPRDDVWFTIGKTDFLTMVASMWPDEVALLGDEFNDDEE